ncbi:MAG: hypothetical protein WBG50_09405 [Desulfomonilaceae bacterium]
MKARLLVNLISTGDRARNYLGLDKGPRRRPPIDALYAPSSSKAQKILETIQNQNLPDDLDINITGKNLIAHMDNDFDDKALLLYHFGKAAAEAGEGFSIGSYVIVPNDARKFRPVAISRRHGSVQITDAVGGLRISRFFATAAAMEEIR